jgi:hypothetical protein
MADSIMADGIWLMAWKAAKYKPIVSKLTMARIVSGTLVVEQRFSLKSVYRYQVAVSMLHCLAGELHTGLRR